MLADGAGLCSGGLSAAVEACLRTQASALLPSVGDEVYRLVLNRRWGYIV